MDNGIFVQDYLTDSGTFKANSFVKHIHETHQLLKFCETNTHHQNGVAERAIQIISNMAYDSGCQYTQETGRMGLMHHCGHKMSFMLLISTAIPPKMESSQRISLLAQQFHGTNSWICMCGNVHCKYNIQRYSKAKSFLDGNLAHIGECSWVSVNSTQA
jgi:hypothetical protein